MTNNIPITKLIGDAVENFYHLGLKDKIAYQELRKGIATLSKLDGFTEILEKTIGLLESKINHTEHFEEYMKSYASGLGVTINEFRILLYLPEVISSQSFWLPNFLGLIPGCSSLFFYDKKTKSTHHSRILDFPLTQVFNQHERIIQYQFKNAPKIFSYSCAGLPFPGLTSMNEHGLSVAIHQKFSNFFDAHGESIFSIVFDIINNAKTTNEARKILRNKHSMTLWGLYMADKEGNVFCADICGKTLNTEHFKIEDQSYFYFNNIPIKQDYSTENAGPFYYKDLCSQRFKNFKNFAKNKKITFENSLQILCQHQPLNANKSTQWTQPPITMASVQAVSFNLNKLETMYIPGAAPKLFKGELVHIKKPFAFKDHDTENITKDYEHKLDPQYIKGLQLLAQAQAEYDLKKYEKSYHCIQMSKEYLREYADATIAQFFFIVWQYIFSTSNDDLKAVHRQFIKIKKSLPNHLKEHCFLFINRIEQICSMHSTVKITDLKHERAQYIFEKESKLKGAVIKGMKKLIYPRLELPDIIYMY